MLVLPTFELALPAPVADDAPIAPPASKQQLADHPAVRPFTCGTFCQPADQSSLDYSAWWEAGEACEAQYKPLWEPLGVVARGLAPPYDERFRGYGRCLGVTAS